MTAWVTLSSIELVGVSVPTHGSPSKYLPMIFSAVRGGRARQVGVGLGPPKPLQRAEFEEMKSRSTKRASALASRTESAGSEPIRIVDWTCRIRGGQSMRITFVAPAARRRRAALSAQYSRFA